MKITPRTVAREKNSIQRVFTYARMKQWDGCENLDNPFERIEIPGASFERDRILKEGELDRLEQACKLSRGKDDRNREYIPLAIWFAIYTGMRLQEIFNLAWTDINHKARTITIRKSKTDRKQKRPGRTIVLPFVVAWILHRIMEVAKLDRNSPPPNRPIFPMSKLAFKQAWKDVVKRAGIPSEHTPYLLNGQMIAPDGVGLKFLDLRREASTMFHAAGLTEPETQYMLGHSGNTITSRVYIQVNAKVIVDKIDRHIFGKTQDEIMAEGRANYERWKEINGYDDEQARAEEIRRAERQKEHHAKSKELDARLKESVKELKKTKAGRDFLKQVNQPSKGDN